MRNKIKATFLSSKIQTSVLMWIGNLCLACILISFLTVIYPKLPEGWDVLSFAGAIIGGSITWFGVKRTLLEERRDSFITGYDLEMKELVELSDKLTFISNIYLSTEIALEQYRMANGEFVNENEKRTYIIQTKGLVIVKFIKTLEGSFDKLYGNVEFELIQKLKNKVKFMQAYKIYNKDLDGAIRLKGLDKFEEMVDEHQEKSEEIYSIIKDHIKERSQTYKRIKKSRKSL
ncbi:hypothetical protein [Paenibacillus sp. Marseille-Q4541]|uniref:hypothetical protein n=1 Tax=Paenibacillus sp. Marseille-Q4541 TaxID=2831522 RepID=UPI001BAD23F8|nr:hypothetical protein [Paenibacillus sp. Marseille-Q4541]